MGFPIHLRKTEHQLLFVFFFFFLMYIQTLLNFCLKSLKNKLNSLGILTKLNFMEFFIIYNSLKNLIRFKYTSE